MRDYVKNFSTASGEPCLGVAARGIESTLQGEECCDAHSTSELGQSRHSKGAVVTSDLHPTPDILLRRITLGGEPVDP